MAARRVHTVDCAAPPKEVVMSALRAAGATALLAIALASGCAQRGGGYDPVVADPAGIDAEHPPTLDAVAIPSGGVLMNGVVYVADGAGPHPVAILLHGFPGDERHADLAHALRRAGWNVLLFHYRGAWGSPGAFSFANAIEDVGAAVDLVRSPAFATAFRADPRSVVLVGHSMGGFLALVAASERADVRCVASLAGANLGLFGLAARDPKGRSGLEQGFGPSMRPIQGVTLDALIDELAAQTDAFDTTRRAAALADRPLLLVAGARDDVTPPGVHHEPLVAALASAGAQRVTSATLDADHAFSSRRIALAHTLVEWMEATCAQP
jgi:pimeloyl-ACP methyl ester carboxylesterase